MSDSTRLKSHLEKSTLAKEVLDSQDAASRPNAMFSESIMQRLPAFFAVLRVPSFGFALNCR